MVELKRLPVLHLLQSTSSWTDQSRLDTAVTALLIADLDIESHNVIFAGLRAGRYRVDTKLVVDLYAACPEPLKKRLVASSVFGYLEPGAFERRFLETFRSEGLTAQERRDLTRSLRTFLWRLPERRDRFASLILDLMRGSEWNRVRGLQMAELLSSMDERDREIVKRSLGNRMREIRMSAHNLLFWWLKRKSELSPDLRGFCMSPEVNSP